MQILAQDIEELNGLYAPPCNPPIAEQTQRVLPHHRDHLRESGLTDATISQADIHSITDPRAIAEVLNWQRPASQLGPCLAFPFRNLDGSSDHFVRLRPDRPRADADGKIVTYEQPKDQGLRAYFTVGAVEAIRKRGETIGFTEGEKKALAADQAGCPTIGLTGVFAWTSGKENGERKLINDLDGIQWVGRKVWIGFDTDAKRNPQVNLARAELARVLTDRGADVVLIDLPVGPRDADDLPGKMGLDDYVVKYDEDAFRELVADALSGSGPKRSLGEYRKDLARVRIESLEKPGIYIDTSPTGSGKSYADLAAIKEAESSLTVVATHRNCQEVVEMQNSHGIEAKAFPPLDETTCGNLEEAERALSYGLSVASTVCGECVYFPCEYHFRMTEAKDAKHRVATHQRAALTFDKIASGCKYIAIHEDPTDVLCPTLQVDSGFGDVAELCKQASWMDHDKDGLPDFFQKMAEAASWLVNELDKARDTVLLPLPTPVTMPDGNVDRALHEAMKQTGIYSKGDALRICKDLAAGGIATLMVRVDQPWRPGGKEHTKKRIYAIRHAPGLGGIPTWLADATADPDEIQDFVGGAVIDGTPSGEIERKHPVVQVPRDVKKSTGTNACLNLLRGVLAAFPDARRVGVICDSNHAPSIKGTARQQPNLDRASQRRIAKVEYFRGGEARGSNTWLDECDLLIVLGTPRVPTYTVKDRLILRGNMAAAERDEEWGPDWWSGIDRAGKRHTVKSLGYRDRDWHSAHRAKVAAELKQAAGRGRSICDNGIPVVIVSTEEFGYPILDREIQPITDGMLDLLQQMWRLVDEKAKKQLGIDPELTDTNPIVYIGNVSVTTREIAAAGNLSERQVRRLLNKLAEVGLVVHVGKRTGWQLNAAAEPFLESQIGSVKER